MAATHATRVQGPAATDGLGDPIPVDLTGGAGALGVTNVPSRGDAQPDGNIQGIGVAAAPELYNGTTSDRQRNNVDAVVLALAARVASVNSANQTNFNARGILLVVNVTAFTALGLGFIPFIDAQDPAGGGAYQLGGSPGSIVAVGTYVYVLYPGVTIPAAATAIVQVNSVPLPRVWRVRMFHNDALSYTYSVSASYIL